MTEIELKFQVPKERRAALAKAVNTASARRVRLQAQYFDTAERRLAQALLALRVRKEGRRWVQTLKGAGDGLWQRLEHEVALTVPPGQAPLADPALHDGTPAGEALRKALRDAPLVPTYATEVTRQLRLVRAPGCVVELALDQGALSASGQRWPVHELEFELKGGSATAMTRLAARWVTRFELSLDTRTKSERGDRLARGERGGAPVKARALRLPAQLDGPSAVRAIVGSCLQQVLGNASEMAHGEATPEHLHQLRVGMRRLRTALRELGGLLPTAQPQWQAALAGIFAQLGAARDVDALQQVLVPALRKAGAPLFDLPPDAAAVPPETTLRAAATNLLWLELLACAADAGDAGGAEAGKPFLPQLGQRLARLHRQVVRDARRFEHIDDTARHKLRKRIKRLRYLCDFGASLFAKKALKTFIRPLAAAQEALGAFNDVCVAQALFDRVASDDTKALFALGWLAHERDSAIARSVVALTQLRKAPVFW